MADEDTDGDMEKGGDGVHAPPDTNASPDHSPPGRSPPGRSPPGRSPPGGAPFRATSWYGPRPIAALVPAVTRTAFRRGVPGAWLVLEAWPAIVGPLLAEVTQPRGLGRGTLTIACVGPVAMELQHLSSELLQRINRFLGGEPVQRLRFVQTLTPPVAPPVRPVATPAIERAVEKAVATLPEGPVRDALTALGRAVLTEAATRA